MRSLKAYFVLVVLGSLCIQDALAQGGLGAQGAEAEPHRMQQWLVPTPAMDVRRARACFGRPATDRFGWR